MVVTMRGMSQGTLRTLGVISWGIFASCATPTMEAPEDSAQARQMVEEVRLDTTIPIEDAEAILRVMLSAIEMNEEDKIYRMKRKTPGSEIVLVYVITDEEWCPYYAFTKAQGLWGHSSSGHWMETP